MDLHDALATRRTIHRYRPDPVPDAVVQRALELAQLAPNHRLTLPWRFMLLGRETRRALVPRAVELASLKQAITDEIAIRIEARLTTPPLAIAVACLESPDALRQQEDLAAVACAIQNLCLSLHADGLGSKWGSGAITRDAATYAALGIDPAELRLLGFIWVGYAEGPAPVPPRPPVEAVVRRLP